MSCHEYFGPEDEFDDLDSGTPVDPDSTEFGLTSKERPPEIDLVITSTDDD